MYQETVQSVKYHRQDTSDDCGQACVQMVISSFNGQLYEQEELIDDLTLCPAPAESVDDGWGANPHCLKVRLQAERGSLNGTRAFKLLACDSEEAVSRWIVYSLFSSGAAPCVVVKGNTHWVAVYACDVEPQPANPFDPCDRSYTIKAFYLRDPAPGLPWNVNAIPHGDNDQCGQGVIAPGQNWGLASRRVKYKSWQKHWLTGIPDDPTGEIFWAGKYVAVVDVTEPFLDSMCCPAWEQVPPAPPALMAGPSGGSRALIGEEAAREVAIAGLKDDGLYGPDASPHWKYVLDRTVPGRVDLIEPPYSNADDNSQLSYYLVQLEIQDGSSESGSVPVLVIVDAFEREVLETAAVAQRGTNAIVFTPEAEIVEFLTRGPIIIDDPLQPIKLTPEEIQAPRKVWQHAPSSLSPYAPYYQYTIRGRKLYIRVDDRSIFELYPTRNERAMGAQAAGALAAGEPAVDLGRYTKLYST